MRGQRLAFPNLIWRVLISLWAGFLLYFAVVGGVIGGLATLADWLLALFALFVAVTGVRGRLTARVAVTGGVLCILYGIVEQLIIGDPFTRYGFRPWPYWVNALPGWVVAVTGLLACLGLALRGVPVQPEGAPGERLR